MSWVSNAAAYSFQNLIISDIQEEKIHNTLMKNCNKFRFWISVASISVRKNYIFNTFNEIPNLTYLPCKTEHVTFCLVKTSFEDI